MRIAASFSDLSGRCQIRPITEADIARFSIPRFPPHAITWIFHTPHPVGYGGFFPVPGRDKEADLFLYIRPQFRLLGHGQQLGSFLIDQARAMGFERLFSVSDSPQAPYAYLLREKGFEFSYSELEMYATITSDIAAPEIPLMTLPEYESAVLLRRLYNDSFAGETSFLPYVSETHILDDFGLDSDILFLMQDGEAVGFVGLRYEDGSAEIEPFGIVRSHQSQKLGHKLMHSTLHWLAQRDIFTVRLSVREENFAGVQIAEAHGFHQIQARTYFSRDLK